MRRKSTDLKLETLASTPGLTGCEHRELRELGRIGDELDLPAGHTLAREGAGEGQTWVVLQGRVEIRRFGVLLWEAGPGDLVGDLRVLGPVLAPVTVTATTDVRALLLDGRAAETILQHPGLARWAFANLQRQVREVIGASTDPRPPGRVLLDVAEWEPALA